MVLLGLKSGLVVAGFELVGDGDDEGSCRKDPKGGFSLGAGCDGDGC